MATLLGFRIQNFKALKDVTLGRLVNTQKVDVLTPLVAVIGKNGAGKSSLFDALGFIADCLNTDVESACDLKQRGGFKRLISKGSKGPIQFDLYYRESELERPISYHIQIALDSGERPYVKTEELRLGRKSEKSGGQPFTFLTIQDGSGAVWSGKENVKGELKERETVQLSDQRQLAIATLGALKKHDRISKFREFLKGWYLSYFTPDAARSLPMSGPQKHLNIHGDNISNVVQFMEREHKDRFKNILDQISKKIPGVSKIDTKATDDGRLLLRFNDGAFSEPFYAQQMSDGTLKVFSYLLMLEDPSPPPFICIEEPENGLYPKLLETLAHEFRNHASGKTGSSQVFVTTHQPYLVDALTPQEVWILQKQKDGFSTIKRASDTQLVQDLYDQDLPLGGLWFSDYLDGA